MIKKVQNTLNVKERINVRVGTVVAVVEVVVGRRNGRKLPVFLLLRRLRPRFRQHSTRECEKHVDVGLLTV
jgi:hypothetical protein